MPIGTKELAESIQNLTDSIIKLSTALLVVPMVFLKFVSEVGPKAHPDALQGLYPVSNWLKLGIFVPLGLSILLGLLSKYTLLAKLRQEMTSTDGQSSRSIMAILWCSGIFFIVGLSFLICLFFKFPIEISEPFRIGRTPLG